MPFLYILSSVTREKRVAPPFPPQEIGESNEVASYPPFLYTRQTECGATGESPTRGHEDDEGTGATLL